MMWTHGQSVERHEVEYWIAEAYSFPQFKAHVSQAPDAKNSSRIRVTIRLTGPNDERIVHPVEPNREACYYSLKDAVDALPQIEGYAA